MGLSRGRVSLLFFVEGTLLGGASALLGGFLGAVLAQLLNAAHLQIEYDSFRNVYLTDALSFSVDGLVVARVVVVFTILTAIGSLGPAVVASRLRPVEALRHAT
jgi:ABC-type lipoprotein release transport system permease subunit